MEKSESMLLSWLQLDWIGTLLSLLMVTFLLIGVQWGGNERPWNDGLVIAFLVLVSSLPSQSLIVKLIHAPGRCLHDHFCCMGVLDRRACPPPGTHASA